MAKSALPYSIVRVTIETPGAADGVAETWASCVGGATTFIFEDENDLPGRPTTFFGKHRYDEVVLTTLVPLPASGKTWLDAALLKRDPVREVLVEFVSGNGAVLASARFQNAVLARYEAPKFDASSKASATEAIAFRFESVVEVLEPPT